MLFEDETLGCAHCCCIVDDTGAGTGDFDAKESVARGVVTGLVDGFIGACEVNKVDLVVAQNYGAEGLERG